MSTYSVSIIGLSGDAALERTASYLASRARMKDQGQLTEKLRHLPVVLTKKANYPDAMLLRRELSQLGAEVSVEFEQEAGSAAATGGAPGGGAHVSTPDAPLGGTLGRPIEGAAAHLATTLRPMGILDILDRAFKLYRSNFMQLFLALFVVTAIFFPLKIGLDYAYAPSIGGMTPEPGQPPTMPDFQGYFAYIFSMFLLATVWGLCTRFAEAFIALYVSARFVGQELTVIATFRILRRYLTRIFLAFILMGLGFLALSILLGGYVVIGFMLLVAVGAGVGAAAPPLAIIVFLVGGILVFVPPVIVFLYVYARFMLLVPIIVLEGLGVIDAFARSWNLMSKQPGQGLTEHPAFKGIVLLILTLLLGYIVNLIAAIPAFFVTMYYATKRGASSNPFGSPDPTIMPLFLKVPIELFQVLAQIVVLPFTTLAIVLFYYDRRIRKEGFDLEMISHSMARSSTS